MFRPSRGVVYWCLVFHVKSLRLSWLCCRYTHREDLYFIPQPEAVTKCHSNNLIGNWPLEVGDSLLTVLSSGTDITEIHGAWLSSTCMICLHSCVKLWTLAQFEAARANGLVPTEDLACCLHSTGPAQSPSELSLGFCNTPGQSHGQAHQKLRSHRRK